VRGRTHQLASRGNTRLIASPHPSLLSPGTGEGSVNQPRTPTTKQDSHPCSSDYSYRPRDSIRSDPARQRGPSPTLKQFRASPPVAISSGQLPRRSPYFSTAPGPSLEFRDNTPWENRLLGGAAKNAVRQPEADQRHFAVFSCNVSSIMRAPASMASADNSPMRSLHKSIVMACLRHDYHAVPSAQKRRRR